MVRRGMRRLVKTSESFKAIRQKPGEAMLRAGSITGKAAVLKRGGLCGVLETKAIMLSRCVLLPQGSLRKSVGCFIRWQERRWLAMLPRGQLGGVHHPAIKLRHLDIFHIPAHISGE